MNNEKQIPAFGFTRKTRKLVNREAELKKLKEAVSDKGNDTRILFVTGNGGSGKTRLLEEVESFICKGNCDDKKSDMSVITTPVIDFTDIHLHLYVNFLNHLRDALNRYSGVFFTQYDAAYTAYLNRIQSSVEHRAIKAVAEELESAFWADYASIAKEKRIVWLLDTAEQFRYTWQPWLRNTVETDSFLDLTRTFLRNIVSFQIEKIPNTTIIFAGRPNAEPYFEEIKTVHKKYADAKSDKLTSLSISFFKEEDTRSYLQYLADDIEREYPHSGDADRLRAIATGDGEIDLRVLHKYTAGQPIRLALFTDLVMEEYDLPESLFDSWEKAEQHSEEEIAKIQEELDSAFIELIFERTDDIRSDILLTLARARYGLTARQLAWILFGKPNIHLKYWHSSKEEKEAIDRIEAIFDGSAGTLPLSKMSFIKKATNERWILQDEMYTLFDQHMAKLHNLEREKENRKALYQKIITLIKFELDALNAQRRIYFEKDKNSLEFLSPTKALDSSFEYINEIELSERDALRRNIEAFELELLHYQLRADTPDGLLKNIRETELQGRSDANRHAFTRLNLWRLSTQPDKHDSQSWKKFLSIPENLDQADFEVILQAREPIELISTLFFRDDYYQAIESEIKIEKAIKKAKNISKEQQKYLNHPLFVIERQMWKEFAEIYAAREAKNADDINELIEKLNGYSKTADATDPVHKLFAHSIEDLLGNLYNTQGYAYVARGEYRKARDAYKKALKQWRQTKYRFMEATTRNNYARVLSELGLIGRAERICRDALAIREAAMLERPVGYSHNTLALIYNNGLQPENAWVEAAMGVAYHRRAENERGLGLAHFHLAEALRRLVRSPRAKLNTPEQLLKASEQSIKTALEIFDKKDKKTGKEKEPLRKIEALIELGSLHRDYVRYHMELSEQNRQNEEHHKKIAQARYQEALKTFDYAIKLADEYEYPHLKIDALIDIVWVHYYAQEKDEALDKFEEAQKEIYKKYPESEFKIVSDEKKKYPPEREEVEPHVFMRLAKLWDVKARIELNSYRKDREDHKARGSNVQDLLKNEDMMKKLKNGAEAYILELGYNQLYSPRSPYIAIIFGNLYDRLKKFYPEELEKFNEYQKKITEEYSITKIKPLNLIDMDSFLDDSFGIKKNEESKNTAFDAATESK